MLKQSSILLIIFAASVCAFAQTEKYNAPVKWERYKVSEMEVSVLFPKLPTLISTSNVCSQEETNVYTAYAENVVYSFSITEKSNEKIPSFCRDKKKFDERNFTNRLTKIKSELNTQTEKKYNQNGMEVVKVNNNVFAYWLINDFNNKRYFQLWTTDTDEKNVSVQNFVESFKVEDTPSGIEIGKGSYRTLGDEITADKAETETKNLTGDEKELVKMRVIAKPQARYTDAARQENSQGTVSLRVTFLASGGIGSITPVKTLPYGLTEQAIAAAAKIAFVPANRNGVPMTMTRIVEYSFNIY